MYSTFEVVVVCPSKGNSEVSATFLDRSTGWYSIGRNFVQLKVQGNTTFPRISVLSDR